jgi:hypothetical protein
VKTTSQTWLYDSNSKAKVIAFVVAHRCPSAQRVCTEYKDHVLACIVDGNKKRLFLPLRESVQMLRQPSTCIAPSLASSSLLLSSAPSAVTLTFSRTAGRQLANFRGVLLLSILVRFRLSEAVIRQKTWIKEFGTRCQAVRHRSALRTLIGCPFNVPCPGHVMGSRK